MRRRTVAMASLVGLLCTATFTLGWSLAISRANALRQSEAHCTHRGGTLLHLPDGTYACMGPERLSDNH